MDQLSFHGGRIDHDPAVLAFLKCHVTSFLRWDVVRLLVAHGDRWTDAQQVAHELHKRAPDVAATLHALSTEGLLETRDGPTTGRAYRLDPHGPSTRVAERLVDAARRSHELRELIVARVTTATLAS